MPMMMDDIDDLFTDIPNIPPPPAIPGLPDRIDELRSTGCCQKLTWSKFGCIAYITADGARIGVSNLCFRAETGTWDQNLHNDPMLTDSIFKIYKGRQLAHISWNHNGLELLVADTYGKLSIFSIFIAVNRFVTSKAWPNDPEDDLNTLVGTTWLNAKKTAPLYRSATKEDGQWNLPFTNYEFKGPYNPYGKTSSSTSSALLAVTKGGYVRLIYQDPNHQWQDVRYELDGFSQSADLLTHAALCPGPDDTLLIAVHDSNKRLRIYRAAIDWQLPKPGEQTTSPPSINCQHITSVDECCYTSEYNTIQAQMFMMAPVDAQLSHLEFLQERQGEDCAPPTVLAIFSYLGSQYNGSDLRDQTFSVVSRWELQKETSNLHSAFSQLSAQKPTSSMSKEKDRLKLKRIEDIRMDHLIVQVNQLSMNTVLAFFQSDGGIEFRDRTSMQLLVSDENDDKVTGLAQNGFSFHDGENCLHAALSPNTCVKVSLSKEAVPRIFAIQIPGMSLDQNHLLHLERINMSFVLLNVVADTGNINNDDLLMTINTFMRQLTSDKKPESKAQCKIMEANLLTEMYKTLKINPDRSLDAQHEKLLRYPIIQRCFSLQAALGYRVISKKRSLPSKLAWTLLNLRMIALSFAFAFLKTSGAEMDLSSPDVLNYMVGLISWSMALTDYIVDQLFTLLRLVESPEIYNRETLRSKLNELSSPSIPLILASSSRTFLKYNCRGLRGVRSTALSTLKVPHSPLHTSAQALDQIFEAAFVGPDQLEALLGEAESAIRKAYEAASFGEAERQAVETHMLVTGIIPDVLLPVLQQLLVAADKLRGEVDEAELAFKDFSSLGLGDDRRTRRWAETHSLDVIRKIEIKKEGVGVVKLRVCARCGSCMEDLVPVRGAKAWMMNLQRTCFCGGFWLVN